MKKTEKQTQLKHIRNGKVFNVFAKNWSMINIGTLFIKENGVELVISRNQCTNTSNIDKKTKKIKHKPKQDFELIEYGINDFGYPNSYWE